MERDGVSAGIDAGEGVSRGRARDSRAKARRRIAVRTILLVAGRVARHRPGHGVGGPRRVGLASGRRPGRMGLFPGSKRDRRERLRFGAEGQSGPGIASDAAVAAVPGKRSESVEDAGVAGFGDGVRVGLRGRTCSGPDSCAVAIARIHADRGNEASARTSARRDRPKPCKCRFARRTRGSGLYGGEGGAARSGRRQRCSLRLLLCEVCGGFRSRELERGGNRVRQRG